MVPILHNKILNIKNELVGPKWAGFCLLTIVLEPFWSNASYSTYNDNRLFGKNWMILLCSSLAYLSRKDIIITLELCDVTWIGNDFYASVIKAKIVSNDGT